MGAVCGSGGVWLRPQGGQHPWDRPPVQGTDPGRHPKARLGSPPGLGAGGRLQPLLHSTNIFPSNFFCTPLTFLRVLPLFFCVPSSFCFFLPCGLVFIFSFSFIFSLPCRIIFFGTPEASCVSWRIKNFFCAVKFSIYNIIF